MNPSKLRSELFLYPALLVALCIVLYLPYLGRTPFFNKGEPREALVVQSIVSQGQWLFPLKSGADIPSKPPLFHWVGALTSLAWGKTTEATVRFPSALFATLGVLTLYILGRKLFDSQAALFAGIILATSALYQQQAVEARVDMTLAFFVTLALVVFYLLYRDLIAGPWWTYGFYLILGVSVLAKGPVGLVIPGMVICFFLASRKRWDFLSRLLFHRGVFLTLAVGVAWYGMALMIGGQDFFNRQVLHENLARFFVYGEGGTGHQKPFYYYFPYLFLEGLPWSLFLPFMIIDWIKDRTYSEEGHLFLMLWVGVVFVFFSLAAGKRSVYLLPLYPPLCLLTASWFQTARPTGKIGMVGLRSLGGLFLLVGIVLAAVLWQASWGYGESGFFSALAAPFGPDGKVHLLLLEKVLEQPGWFFFSLLSLAVSIWLFSAWDLLQLRVSRVPLKLSLATLVIWLIARSAFVPAMAQARSYRPFMDEVNRFVAHDGKLYLYGRGFDSGSLFFYRGASIPHLAESSAELVEKLRSGSEYVVMSEQEWHRIRSLDGRIPPPLVRSEGSGPDGDARLVLIRGIGDRTPR